MKLLKIIPSKKKDKRFAAYFLRDSGREKVTHFGQPGATTYIDGASKAKREAFRARHKRDLRTKDPSRAGYLSYYVLWGDTPSLGGNIKRFKKQFNL